MERLGDRGPIEVHDLIKRYGRVTALSGLSFKVQEGEIYGLLGLTARVRPRPSRYWWVCSPPRVVERT